MAVLWKTVISPSFQLRWWPGGGATQQWDGRITEKRHLPLPPRRSTRKTPHLSNTQTKPFSTVTPTKNFANTSSARTEDVQELLPSLFAKPVEYSIDLRDESYAMSRARSIGVNVLAVSRWKNTVSLWPACMTNCWRNCGRTLVGRRSPFDTHPRNVRTSAARPFSGTFSRHLNWRLIKWRTHNFPHRTRFYTPRPAPPPPKPDVNWILPETYGLSTGITQGFMGHMGTNKISAGRFCSSSYLGIGVEMYAVGSPSFLRA